jgi:hypothetical protein
MLTMLLGSVPAHGQIRCPEDKGDDEASTRFVISIGTVTMPVGAFLLVRKQGQIGAIRLTSIDPAASRYEGKFNYESFFSATGSLPLDGDHRTGQLDIGPTKGVHAVYTHAGGNHDAHIGRWTFHFSYPTLMEMSDSSFWRGYGEHGYEFAPTSACQLSEVDISDKRLHWFRWDRSTQVSLPLADLPK